MGTVRVKMSLLWRATRNYSTEYKETQHLFYLTNVVFEDCIIIFLLFWIATRNYSTKCKEIQH